MNLINKALQMIKQAYISTVNDDSSVFPTTEVSYNSKKSNVIRFSPYGLCSNTPTNSNVILLSADGQESLKYALSDDMQNRYKNLKEGEVVLYNYMSGSYTYLKENGDIETECKNNEIINVVGDSNITIGGDATIDVTGDVTVNAGGDVIVDAGGVLEGTAVTSATITAPTINLTGNVLISGTLGVLNGSLASFSGAITSIGDVTGNGKVLSTHTHPQSVDSAGDTQQNTGAPN